MVSDSFHICNHFQSCRDYPQIFCHRLLLMKDGALVSDLCPEKLTRQELERALGEIYGPVEVLCHRGSYVMIGGERT